MAIERDFYGGLNNHGHLIKVSKRFGYMREFTLRLYDNNELWVHLNDNSKCFNEEKYLILARVNLFPCSTTKYRS